MTFGRIDEPPALHRSHQGTVLDPSAGPIHQRGGPGTRRKEVMPGPSLPQNKHAVRFDIQESMFKSWTCMTEERSLHPVPRDNGPLMLAVGLGAALLIARQFSPGIPDGGDGVMHYQHAHFFWKHAHVALSQWGKPVFSLLASAFATLGLQGLVLFDVVCAIITCHVIMLILDGTRERLWWWAVPVLLFFTPVYVGTVIAGLTEPLFGLFSVTIVWLLGGGRCRMAMALVSLLPLVRPEYAAFAPFAVGAVLWDKEPKALLWLVCGPVLYVLLSMVLLGSPFMFFSDHTYLGKDLYGRGDPWMFVENVDSMYGGVLKRVFVFSLLALGWLLWKDRTRREAHVRMALLTLAPAVGIFALHGYAWYKGGMGSMGLLRVMSTTVPLLVLFIAYVCSQAWRVSMPDRRWSTWVFAVMLLFVSNNAFHELERRVELPVQEGEVQQLQRQVSAYLDEHRREDERLIALDPTIMMLSGLDPWDSSRTLPIAGYQRLLHPDGARVGDWVVWDAHFAANEGELPLEMLQADHDFNPVAVFRPTTDLTTLGGGPYSIHLFQRIDGQRDPRGKMLFDLARPFLGVRTERCDTVRLGREGYHFTQDEFPLTLVDLPVATLEVSDKEVLIRVEVVNSMDTGLYLVMEDGRYLQERLYAGKNEVRFQLKGRSIKASNKLYLWNSSGHPLVLRGFEVTLQDTKRVVAEPDH